MKVKNKYLIIIAGIVWLIAGINILRIGLKAYVGDWNLNMILIAFGVFLIFHIFIFRNIVNKHVHRIQNYKEPKHNIFHFFDTASYCIMGAMITLGIGLRVSGICSDVFIAVFYSGLGSSLVIAGISFELHYLKM